MPSTVVTGATAVLLALVSLGAGVAVLMLCDRHSEWLVSAESGSGAARRLRILHCLAAAATAIVVVFVVLCARL